MAVFEGTKTYNLSDFNEFDLISDTEVSDIITVKYIANYEDYNGVVSLTAIAEYNGQMVEDTIYGLAFIDENGNANAIMDFDGEQILLSELQEAGVIENCGWFKKIYASVIAAVVVSTVVACVVVSGGAALGAVVGICAVAGGIAGGAASAIVGAIDGEVSFGEVAGNFGIGFAVGAVTGAITGFTVGKIQLGAASKYDVGFGKGSFNSVNETINYHFGRHGAEVGAKNASQYLHKAIQVARDVVKNNIAPIRAVTGTTSNVYRYIVGDYYIHMAIEGAKIIIVSFGLRG